MTAFQTFGRLDSQVGIVTFCQHVAGQSKIIIYVNASHIQTGETGLTMVALHADTGGLRRREAAQNRVILFRFRRLQKVQDTPQILPVTHTGKHDQNAGVIQRILNTIEYIGTRSAPVQKERFSRPAVARR